MSPMLRWSSFLALSGSWKIYIFLNSWVEVLLQPYLPASEENAAMKSTEGGKNHDMLGLCATKLKIFKKNISLLFELEDSLIKN